MSGSLRIVLRPGLKSTLIIRKNLAIIILIVETDE